MRSAAIRLVLLALLALCGVAASGAAAGIQLDPIGTVTSLVGTITSQVNPVTSQVDPVISSVSTTASGDLGSVLPTGGGTASGSSDSGSSSSGGTQASGSGSGGTTSGTRRSAGKPRIHTRFDRLPQRYETLLERIELGQNVQANLRRLRALLASAPPALRARIIAAIRREIERLQHDGHLGPGENAMIHRLARLLDALDGTLQPTPTLASASRLERIAAAGIGVAPTSFSSAARSGSEAGSVGHAGPGGHGLAPGVPISPSTPLFWILLLFLAGGMCLLLFLTLLPRDSLPSFAGGLVSLRRLEELRALALTVLLAGLLAVGLVLVLV